jgi:hypothetical protein
MKRFIIAGLCIGSVITVSILAGLYAAKPTSHPFGNPCDPGERPSFEHVCCVIFSGCPPTYLTDIAIYYDDAVDLWNSGAGAARVSKDQQETCIILLSVDLQWVHQDDIWIVQQGYDSCNDCFIAP